MNGHPADPCADRIEALDRMLEGGQADADLARHIEECASCRRYARRLRGLETFLRAAHDGFDEIRPGALDEKRRLEPYKVAAWSAVLVVVLVGAGAGVSLLSTRSRPAGVTPSADQASVVVEEGRVVLASGLAGSLGSGGGAATPADVGLRVTAGSTVETSGDGSLAVRFDSGLLVMAGPSTRMSVVMATSAAVTIRLEEGVVTIRTPSDDDARTLRVVSGEDRVEARSRLLEVGASRGAISGIASAGGAARAVLGRRPVEVAAGMRLDVAGGSARPFDPARIVSSLDLLARGGYRSGLRVLSGLPARVSVDGLDLGAAPVVALLPEGRYSVSLIGEDDGNLHTQVIEVVYGQESLVVARGAAGADSVPGSVPAGPGKAPEDIVTLIREALADGDTAEALALVEKHIPAHAADPEFLSVAGDTFRRLGRHSDAVDAYLAAARGAEGNLAEKAYLAAARLTLEKLRDTGRTEEILAAYWKRFPEGFYELEASFLAARLLVWQKKPAEARTRLEAILSSSPDSYLATKVHLLLGSILVTYMGDCAAAVPHLQAVQKAAPGGTFAEEAARFLDRCDAP